VYNNDLELTIAGILFHNQHLIDYNLVDKRDFFSDIKHAVNKMIKIRKKEGLIDKKSIGRDFNEPDEGDVTKFNDYVVSLKSLSQDRRIQDIPHEMSIIASKSISKYKGLDSNGILDAMEEAIRSYRITVSDTDDHKISELLKTYMDELMDENSSSMIEYGIPDLDVAIGNGSRKGELIIVAGDTKNFKSTLCYNIALNVALRGLPVMFISYEIPTSELLSKFIALKAPINSKVLRSGQMNDDNGNLMSIHKCEDVMNKIHKADKELSELPLHLFADGTSLEEIKMHAMKIKPVMIFVDYLQIMSDIDGEDTKQLSRRIQELKNLANESKLNCAIFALSQFKRATDESMERTHNDLYGSSQISKAADLVLITKKKDTIDRINGGKACDIEIKIDLNRHGESGEKVVLPIIPKWGLIKERKKEGNT